MSQLTDLTCELIKISDEWTAHDLVPDRQKANVIRIGVALNSAGGMPAMQYAYYAAKNSNPHASVIQAYWDGIGEWRW